MSAVAAPGKAPAPARAAGKRKRDAWLVPAVITGALVPVVALAVRAARGALGANPIAEALNQLGLLALVLLIASLAMTPLRILSGWAWPIKIRKSLGNLGFFYAAAHLVTYAGLDQALDVAAIARDVTERKFIAVGMLAFLILVPLAATSTSGMLKRLGAARWRRLHRLAYVAPSLGVLHFVWRVKKDLTEPLVYGAILALLFGVRVAAYLRARAAARAGAGS